MSTLSPPEIFTLLKRNLPIEDHRGEIIEEIGAAHLRMHLPVVPEYLSHDLPPGSGQTVLSGPITMVLQIRRCMLAFMLSTAPIFLP